MLQTKTFNFLDLLFGIYQMLQNHRPFSLFNKAWIIFAEEICRDYVVLCTKLKMFSFSRHSHWIVSYDCRPWVVAESKSRSPDWHARTMKLGSLLCLAVTSSGFQETDQPRPVASASLLVAWSRLVKDDVICGSRTLPSWLLKLALERLHRWFWFLGCRSRSCCVAVVFFRFGLPLDDGIKSAATAPTLGTPWFETKSSQQLGGIGIKVDLGRTVTFLGLQNQLIDLHC